jgi:hypothetical protein
MPSPHATDFCPFAYYLAEFKIIRPCNLQTSKQRSASDRAKRVRRNMRRIHPPLQSLPDPARTARFAAYNGIGRAE